LVARLGGRPSMLRFADFYRSPEVKAFKLDHYGK
jgi:hypothetical protein